MHLEDESLVGVAVSEVRVHGSYLEGTKQRMKVALCFLSRAKSQYKLIMLYKTTNHSLTQKLSSSAVVWHIQCISPPSPRPSAGALPPLEHPAQHISRV